jgi:hypothetical protein
MAIHQGKDFSLEEQLKGVNVLCPLRVISYSLVTLSDRVVPGFAGLCRKAATHYSPGFSPGFRVARNPP